MMHINARFHASTEWLSPTSYGATLCGRRKHILFLLPVDAFLNYEAQMEGMDDLPLCRHCARTLRKRDRKNG